MDLYQYARVIWRRKWIITATALAAVCVAVVGTRFMPQTYTASATVRILTIKEGGVDYLERNIQYADRLMNTYASVATSTAVRDELARRLDREFLPAIHVEILANTELLQITVRDSDPFVAAEAANTLADILVTQSQQLYTGDAKLPSDILAEQLRTVEDELVAATARYEAALAEGDVAPLEVELYRQTMDLKRAQYQSLLAQFERTRTTEAVLRGSASVMDTAVVPVDPTSPNIKLNLALGMVGGLAAGLGLAFVFENLDRRLYTTEEIRSAADLPLAGTIPSARSRQRSRLFKPDSIQHEAFKRMAVRLVPPHVDENQLMRIKGIGPAYARRLSAAGIETLIQLSIAPADSLRAMLELSERQTGEVASWIKQAQHLVQQQSGQAGEPPRSFLITSSKPGEGKSTVAANFAVAAAQLRRRALLVDADVRLPTLHKTFDVGNQVGLTSVLTGQTSPEDAIQDSRVPGLELLTSGPPVVDPTGLLGSALMGGLIRQLMGRYDIVVVDSPILLAVSDATVMVPLFDSVLLVVRRDGAQRHTIQAAREHLEDARARLINVVVNRAERSRGERYHRYYQHRRETTKSRPAAVPEQPASGGASQRARHRSTDRKPVLSSQQSSTTHT